MLRRLFVVVVVFGSMLWVSSVDSQARQALRIESHEYEQRMDGILTKNRGGACVVYLVLCLHVGEHSLQASSHARVCGVMRRLHLGFECLLLPLC